MMSRRRTTGWTGELTQPREKQRCRVCKARRTKEGHDPCLGTLPGVLAACCGHGDVRRSYLLLSDMTIIRGHFDHVKDSSNADLRRIAAERQA